MDEPRSTVTTKAFTLYPTQEYIVRQVSNAFFEGNESQAVRHMINFFAKHNVVGVSVPRRAFDGLRRSRQPRNQAPMTSWVSVPRRAFDGLRLRCRPLPAG